MNNSRDLIKQQFLRGMAAAIEADDWDESERLVYLTEKIDDPQIRVHVLNCLLVMPGHWHHQAVTMQIQQLGSASSVPYIRQVLTDGFGMFQYSGSDSAAIAKWFSHALASINTEESIALIREFVRASDPEVAQEMTYRLTRLKA